VKNGEANDEQGRDAQQAGTTSHKIFLREFLLFDENTPDKLALPVFRASSAFVTRRCRTVTFSRIKRQYEFKRPRARRCACVLRGLKVAAARRVFRAWIVRHLCGEACAVFAQVPRRLFISTR
jgi:hypothetical protein